MGSFKLSSTNESQWVWVEYTEKDVNISNNTSALLVKAYFRRKNNGYTSSGRINTTIAVDGVTQSANNVEFINDGTFDSLIFEKEYTGIKHNADGSKTAKVTASSVRVGSGSYSGSGSINAVLETIPRFAQIVSAPDFNDTDNPTITYSNPAGNAVSSLKACISFTGSDDDIEYRDISKTGTSYTFELTEQERNKLLNNVPNDSKAANVKFYVTSTLGSSIEYSILEKTFTLRESDITRPTITEYSLSVNNSGVDARFDGLYIQNISKVNAVMSATAKLGADISQYKVSVGGKSYSSYSVTTDVLRNFGDLDVFFNVVDSRGFTDTKQQTISVVPYEAPMPVPYMDDSAVFCKRCKDDGTVSDSGTMLKIKVGKRFSNVNSINKCAIEWRYREKASQNWFLDTSNDGWDVLMGEDSTEAYSDITVTTVNLDASKEYVVEIRAKDYLSESIPLQFAIPTEDIDMHLGGNAVGIGTYAKRERGKNLSVDWPAYFDKPIYYNDKELLSAFLLASHPIDSYFYTDNEADPSHIFGGYWTPVEGYASTAQNPARYCWKRHE